MPAGWEVVKITDEKKPTQYRLVDDGGTVVLHAKAEAAATGLGQPTKIDVRRHADARVALEGEAVSSPPPTTPSPPRKIRPRASC